MSALTASELAALDKAATLGLWNAADEFGGIAVVEGPSGVSIADEGCMMGVDARLVVALRNNVPRLIRALKVLEVAEQTNPAGWLAWADRANEVSKRVARCDAVVYLEHLRDVCRDLAAALEDKP